MGLQWVTLRGVPRETHVLNRAETTVNACVLHLTKIRNGVSIIGIADRWISPRSGPQCIWIRTELLLTNPQVAVSEATGARCED